MAMHTELRTLVEEERVLIRAAAKLNAQLIRLRVEEMALVNQIRQSQPPSIDLDLSTTGAAVIPEDENPEDVNRKLVCLDIKRETSHDVHLMVEEEEDDDDDDEGQGQTSGSAVRGQDQLTSFLESMQYKNVQH